jgi:hypothetical protein
MHFGKGFVAVLDASLSTLEAQLHDENELAVHVWPPGDVVTCSTIPAIMVFFRYTSCWDDRQSIDNRSSVWASLGLYLLLFVESYKWCPPIPDNRKIIII